MVARNTVELKIWYEKKCMISVHNKTCLVISIRRFTNIYEKKSFVPIVFKPMDKTYKREVF